MSVELTLEHVRNMLPCNKYRLDDELEIQPEIMERISRRVVVMNSRMLEAKDDLARLDAELSEDVKTDEPRLNKDLVEGKVKRNPERRRTWERYQAARADYEEWSGVLEAWRQKGFSLNKLCELYAVQYFSRDSVGVNSGGRITRELRGDGGQDQSERRAEMRAASMPRDETTPRRRTLT